MEGTCCQGVVAVAAELRMAQSNIPDRNMLGIETDQSGIPLGKKPIKCFGGLPTAGGGRGVCPAVQKLSACSGICPQEKPRET